MRDDILLLSFLAVFAFLFGSVPFGIIIAKAKGIDLKKVGSGNIGATNVLRSMGKLAAALTLLGDVLKGTLAVAVSRYFEIGSFYEGVIGLSAILGHNFSIFLGFKGGKGVATSIGVLIIYSPIVALVTLVTWLLVVFLTKYSSLGAIVSLGLLPLSVFIFDSQDQAKLWIAFVISLFVLLRHKENIARLFKGMERKIGQR